MYSVGVNLIRTPCFPRIYSTKVRLNKYDHVTPLLDAVPILRNYCVHMLVSRKNMLYIHQFMKNAAGGTQTFQ